MAQVPKHFKLWFDEELAHFGIDFTIDDVLFNCIDKTLQSYVEMAFRVVVQSRNIMTSYPSSYEYVVMWAISWLI
jgi:hypothetical protein